MTRRELSSWCWSGFRRGAGACALVALALLAIPAEVTAFERIDGIVLGDNENFLLSAVIDPAGEFAYFGAQSIPGRVVKIDLETFARVDAITLESGENALFSALIDPAGEFAYFGTLTSPGRVVKIDLETFERVGAITLASGEDNLVSAVIDAAGEFAYFGTPTSPGRVVKIDLETFARVDAITLESDENFLESAVIDPAGEFAYFGTHTEPGRVVKIDLETFARVDAIPLASGEGDLFSAVIDPVGEFAYFGTTAAPGRVVKIDLTTFQRVDAITLENNENSLFSALIDPAGAFAYFGTDTIPGRVVKIDLEAFARVDAITLESGEDFLESAVVDPMGAFAYFGTFTGMGQVVKIGLTAPGLSFALASLDFGGVEVDTTSAPQTATLENTGDADATGLAFSISDPSNGFEIDDNTCGDTLPAGESCEVSVTFTPTAAGEVGATLEAVSAEDVAASLDLSGNGVPETQVFSPVGLAVDYTLLASDGNGLFEPGEQVDIAPAWRNDGGTDAVAYGILSNLVGPGGASYDIVENGVGYGPIPPGEIESCRDSGAGCYQLEIQLAGPDRPALHWDTTVEETLDTSTEDVVHTWTLHVGDSFADVPRASPFYASIETLLHHQVTGGCNATEYCPTGANSRGQMPVFMLKALEGPGYVPPPCVEDEELFDDVPATSGFCAWIQDLANRDVIAGCGGDNYCPGNPMTRAQMAIFLLKTLGGGNYTPPPCTGMFHDVLCPSTFANWIEDLANRGITGGCGTAPPAYCPATPVTRQQMAVFISKTFGFTLYGP